MTLYPEISSSQIGAGLRPRRPETQLI